MLTAEEALKMLDAVLSQVTQPALTRLDQQNILTAISLIDQRLRQDANQIQELTKALAVEIAKNQEWKSGSDSINGDSASIPMQ